jgi:hypothetical protein
MTIIDDIMQPVVSTVDYLINSWWIWLIIAGLVIATIWVVVFNGGVR